MIKLAKGSINERISAVGDTIYCGYIVKGSKKNLMIDAGINLFGPSYISSIEEILGDRNRLDYLFLTHSHYDHLGAAGYLKRHIRKLSTASHERVSQLLRKDSVLEMMNELSEIQRPFFEHDAGTEDLSIQPLQIDLFLKEGDDIDLGDLTCRVYEVPGHTRDCLAYYIPELEALFPGEAAGVLVGENGNMEPQVVFLSSFYDYIKSIEKIMALTPKILCIGHKMVLTDGDVMDFLNMSHEATFGFRKFIEHQIELADGNLEKVVNNIARKEYDEKGIIFQERNAYLVSLKAQVRHILGLMPTLPTGVTIPLGP